MSKFSFFILAVMTIFEVIDAQGPFRPTIGILMQKSEKGDSYWISANYVKALEGSGAMVVPVWVNRNMTYYQKLMSSLNGLIFPGGSANDLDPTDIGATANITYHLAKELNDNGVYFPILGVCQGLQLLAIVSANMTNLLTPCSGQFNIALPLHFTVEPQKSKLYGRASDEVLKILTSESVTANIHRFCVTRPSLALHNLMSEWKTLTTDNDTSGTEYITSMEHRKYPFFAVQFHPEKPIYDNEYFDFPHTYSSVLANRWFYDMFVEESKKNRNTFPRQDNVKRLVENRCPKFESSAVGVTQMYYYDIPLVERIDPVVSLV